MHSPVGPPVDRDGVILTGEGAKDAQPPCMLRFSPQLYAKEPHPPPAMLAPPRGHPGASAGQRAPAEMGAARLNYFIESS